MLLNGQPATAIALQDRGLAYGDGLFETILVRERKPVLLAAHLARLQRGCVVLGLQPAMELLNAEISQVLATATTTNCLLKLTLTRVASGRGYRPATAECNRVLTLHALPDGSSKVAEEGIRVFVCQQRLAQQSSLAGLKHLNRLEQVLASREWPDDSFHEGLMLDTAGLVIEGTRSNVFAVVDGQLLTPQLDQCGVAGVMRAWLLQRFNGAAIEGRIALDQLRAASEVFLCNSVFGVWPVVTVQHKVDQWSYALGPHTRQALLWARELF